MDAIRFSAETDYTGSGISQGLARGLLVWAGPQNLTGEGMGIGNVAIRTDEFTCFSRSSASMSDNASHLIRTFALDTKMSWRFRGKTSPRLTRLAECAISLYMHFPHLQRFLMAPVLTLRKITGVAPAFESIPLRAEVTFTYAIEGTGVDVRVLITPTTGLVGTVCILNELSADYFSAGWRNGRIDPPPGWQALPEKEHPPSLYDPVHDIRFTVTEISVNPPVKTQLFWGREKRGDLCWAGFCIELGIYEGSRVPEEIRYRIEFARGVSA